VGLYTHGNPISRLLKLNDFRKFKIQENDSMSERMEIITWKGVNRFYKFPLTSFAFFGCVEK
jgi:hypothetical protein